jgi:hypothetical protein
MAFPPQSLDRLWKDILARPGGAMTLRFIPQPAMAAIAALRDGINDARREQSISAIVPEQRRAIRRTLVGADRLDGENLDSRHRHGRHLPVAGAEDLLSGPSGGDRDLVGVRFVTCCCADPFERAARHWVAELAERGR